MVLLQPTSPFRNLDSLRRGIELFRSGGGRAVVGVSPAGSHPWWCYSIEAGLLRPYIDGKGAMARSQDLPPAFAINGSFYMVEPEQLRERRSFVDSQTLPLRMEDPRESIDIDTEWDWRIAEAVLPLAPIAT
jgi:N-acylneuraminate cytidylyltransferase